MPKTTLGRLPREAIRMLELPRLPQDILEGYRRLVDLTGTVSDAMDETARCRSAAFRCGRAILSARTRLASPSCRASGQPRCWTPRAS